MGVFLFQPAACLGDEIDGMDIRDAIEAAKNKADPLEIR